jgi:hypothetical protein
LLAIVVSGCAGGPLTPREKGTLAGAAIGAGAGAAVGSALGNPKLGAVIGGVAGAVAGAAVGDHVQGQTPAPAPPVPSPPPLSPLTPSAEAGDPTAGAFVNLTPWTVHLNVAPASVPDQPTGFAVGPHGRIAHALDVGTYRVTARATTHTQFGPRHIGASDRTFTVDPQSMGWRVDFRPYDFK